MAFNDQMGSDFSGSDFESEMNPPSPPAPAYRTGIGVVDVIKLIVPILLAGVIYVVGSGSVERFTDARNLNILLLGAAMTGFVSIGMSFVMLSGGVDFSLGAMAAYIGIMVATADSGGGALTQALLLGLLFGAINGFLVAVLRAPAYLITFGALMIFRSTAILQSDGRPIVVEAESITNLMAQPSEPAAIPSIFMGFVALVVIAEIVFFLFKTHPTFFAGPRAVFPSIGRILTTIAIYAGAGLLAGLFAVLTIARLRTAAPFIGEDLPARVIAAVLIGGTMPFRGRGWIIGTAAGVLIIEMLNNIYILNGVAPFIAQATVGGILVVAALYNVLLHFIDSWLRRPGRA